MVGQVAVSLGMCASDSFGHHRKTPTPIVVRRDRPRLTILDRKLGIIRVSFVFESSIDTAVKPNERNETKLN